MPKSKSKSEANLQSAHSDTLAFTKLSTVAVCAEPSSAIGHALRMVVRDYESVLGAGLACITVSMKTPTLSSGMLRSLPKSLWQYEKGLKALTEAEYGKSKYFYRAD
ncbi:hypothetical protein DUZ99_04880 [Xylanibacillus composti]|uniref:Uncharacterized protein n=1 Tax=Xylanibacillus composti TaxID=1572762 RepID=A0A8J4M1J3_9BACL|nr:hypothetical protein [Xylanibacillus composti]MDT9724322.1 hypothetical protein [Xylanibacillus composti]GIQ67912.1 hypothetical protein XYCOK13_07360 [Xylanibacillus composti]